MDKLNKSYIELKNGDSVSVDILNAYDFIKKDTDEYYYVFETAESTSILKLNHRQFRNLLLQVLGYRDSIEKKETSFILSKTDDSYFIKKYGCFKRDLIRKECLISIFENIFKEKRMAS